MRKTVLVMVATCLLVGAVVIVSTARAEDNAEPRQDWSNIKVVAYASGLTGFFDPDTGRLYLYDSNLEHCFTIRELTTLGEPMKKLKN